MKIISIVGPTAVGKTGLALKLAQYAVEHKKYLGVDIISADSRQVYKGLEIISGADVPEHLPDGITLHGVAMIEPDHDWSVSHFQQFALPIIEQAEQQNRLSIIVGGTGLYHDRLFEQDLQLHVGPNSEVRTKAEGMSVEELQAWLRSLVPERFEEMNHSDQQNPRRLVRAIEVALAGDAARGRREAASAPSRQHQYYGLIDDLEKIKSRIHQRVVDRFHHGAVEEVRSLMETYSDWSLPAFSATGVPELRAFIEGSLTEHDCLEAWFLREFQYAKRQITWYKHAEVTWFDVSQNNWQQPAIVDILGT